MEIIHCQDCKRCKDSYCSFWGREVEPGAFCYKAEKKRLSIKPEIISALREIHDECVKQMHCNYCPFYTEEFQKSTCAINVMTYDAYVPAKWDLSVFEGEE